MDLDGKVFKVVRNDGDSPEVTEGTVVTFTQDGDLVSAIYSGGMVRHGRLVGIRKGDHIRHAYIQVNHMGEIRTGKGTMEVQIKKDGKMRVVESWDWTDPPGRGLCTRHGPQPTTRRGVGEAERNDCRPPR